MKILYQSIASIGSLSMLLHVYPTICRWFLYTSISSDHQISEANPLSSRSRRESLTQWNQSIAALWAMGREGHLHRCLVTNLAECQKYRNFKILGFSPFVLRSLHSRFILWYLVVPWAEFEVVAIETAICSVQYFQICSRMSYPSKVGH